MYEKILVPLDGSQRAERILAYVEELAHAFKSKIYLLQIIHPEFLDASVHEYPTMIYRELLDEMRLEAENYLTVVQGKFREKGDRCRNHCRTRFFGKYHSLQLQNRKILT